MLQNLPYHERGKMLPIQVPWTYIKYTTYIMVISYNLWPVNLLSIISLYSYKSEGQYCHVPHDTALSRPTPLGLHSIGEAGYQSYFMEEEDIPEFSAEHSGVNVIYRCDGGLTTNLDLLGVASVQECFIACLLNTERKCWIFRLVFLCCLIELCNYNID